MKYRRNPNLGEKIIKISKYFSMKIRTITLSINLHHVMNAYSNTNILPQIYRALFGEQPEKPAISLVKWISIHVVRLHEPKRAGAKFEIPSES